MLSIGPLGLVTDDARAQARVEIDATHNAVSEATQAPTAGRLVVVVKNINPFLHRYRIVDGKQVTYSESAIADFAKLILAVTIPAASFTATQNPAFARLTALSDAACTFVRDTVVARANAQSLGLVMRFTRLDARFDSIAEALNGFRQAARRPDVGLPCLLIAVKQDPRSIAVPSG